MPEDLLLILRRLRRRLGNLRPILRPIQRPSLRPNRRLRLRQPEANNRISLPEVLRESVIVEELSDDDKQCDCLLLNGQ